MWDNLYMFLRRKKQGVYSTLTVEKKQRYKSWGNKNTPGLDTGGFREASFTVLAAVTVGASSYF